MSAAGGVALGMVGGAIRISTPFLFVSLGECLTEKSGRVNLGLEGTLVMGAMAAYGVSYLTNSPWLGVLAAGGCGLVLGALHAWLCSRPRVNDVAVGIALMLFGIGLAFFLGKPLVGPTAPHLPAVSLGWWSASDQVRSALQVNGLFVLGLATTVAVRFVLLRTRWGLIIRTVGESADAAARWATTSTASACSPRWRAVPGRDRRFVPVAVLSRELERGPLERARVDGGGAGDLRALGSRPLPAGLPAVRRRQRPRPGAAVGRRDVGYYLFNAAPYALTLAIIVATSSRDRALNGSRPNCGSHGRGTTGEGTTVEAQR